MPGVTNLWVLNMQIRRLFPLRKAAELLQVTTEREKYSVCRGQAPWTAPPVQYWGEKGTQKSDLLPCSS